jgi:hypothetical protein
MIALHAAHEELVTGLVGIAMCSSLPSLPFAA